MEEPEDEGYDYGGGDETAEVVESSGEQDSLKDAYLREISAPRIERSSQGHGPIERSSQGHGPEEDPYHDPERGTRGPDRVENLPVVPDHPTAVSPPPDARGPSAQGLGQMEQSSPGPGPIDEARLIEILSEKLKVTAEQFRESIEALPTTIPERVSKGLDMINANERKINLLPIIERRVDEILQGYRQVLHNHQTDFGLPLLTLTTTMTALFCTIIVGITLWATPSLQQITQAEDMLKKVQETAKTHPRVVLYKGAPYVQIMPGSDTTFKDPSGVHTYAKLPER